LVFFSEGFIETLHQIICYITKHEQRSHSGAKLLKLCMKNSMTLLNVGVRVHFEYAESATGRERRCAVERGSRYVF